MMLPYRPFLFALANRSRGGLVPMKSGQLGRFLLWALPVATMLVITAHPVRLLDTVWYFLELLLTLFTGISISAWGPNRALATAKDWWAMTLWGFCVAGLPALIVLAYGLYPLGLFLFAGGLTMAPCYWLGNKIPSKIPQLETGEPMQEVVFGFVLGLAVYLSTLIRSL